MSKRNQMIKFELNQSSGKVITRIDDCVMVTKSVERQRLRQLHFVMSDQLAKYELHTCNYLNFYNFIVKMPPLYPTNLAFKQNARNLNKGHSLYRCLKPFGLVSQESKVGMQQIKIAELSLATL